MNIRPHVGVLSRLGVAGLVLPLLQFGLATLLVADAPDSPTREPLSLALALAALSLLGAFCAVRAGRTRARLVAQNRLLRAEAYTDSLTGLGNRRRFDNRLEAIWSQSVESGHVLSIMLIDVDHFKAFNDLFGHLEGDGVLRSLGDVLRRGSRRDSDEAFRFGGEEFAILLPGTGSVGASKVAADLQRAIAELAISHPASGTGLLTASIGIAQALPARAGSTADAMLTAADQALYEAKKAGRNRIRLGAVPIGRGAGAGGSRDVYVDGCDIIMANGRTIRISSTLDTATLSSILQVVEAKG